MLLAASGVWFTFLKKEPVDINTQKTVTEDRDTKPFGAQYTDTSLFLSAIRQYPAQHSYNEVSGLIVPHHLLAIDVIAQAFASIASNSYSTIVLMSPDHFDAGQSNISVSERNFQTVFGDITTDATISRALKQLPFITEGDFFYREHGLQAILPFVKYYFPRSKVVVMAFKPNVPKNELDAAIAVLEQKLPKDSLVIQSTDFSHYLTPSQAATYDDASINAIVNEKTEEVLHLRQPENLDSVAALYVQSSLQKNFFHNKPIITDHKNSQEYTKEKVTSSTSYLSVVYGKETGDRASGNADLMFVGDIMLSRYIGKIMEERNDYTFPFAKIQPFLKKADVVFANLETPISTRGKSIGSLYLFRSDPKAVESLKYAGIGAVAIANNHAFDYGLEAFEDTLSYLKNAGIAYVGGGENSEEAYRGAELDIHGIKVVILAFTDLVSKEWSATDTRPGISYLDKDKMIKSIAAAKKKSDILIVSFHWGREYETKANERQKEFAQAAVAAGASLIIGHHPHVPQEIGTISNVPVAYSLGNFVFDQNFSKETSTGLLLKVLVKDKKIDSIVPYTVYFNKDYQPYIKELE